MGEERIIADSDEEIDIYLTTAKEYKDGPPAPTNIFSTDQTTLLDAKQPSFHSLRSAKMTAESIYGTWVVNNRKDFVKLFKSIRHYLREINEQIEEGIYDKSVRAYFGMDIETGTLLPMGTSAQLKSAAKKVADGDAAIVAASLPLMLQPTAARTAAFLLAFKTSELTKKSKLVDVNNTEDALVLQRPICKALTIDLGDTTWYTYRAFDNPTRRERSRFWGMVFGTIKLPSTIKFIVVDIATGQPILNYKVRIGKSALAGGIGGVFGFTNIHGELILETKTTGDTFINGELILWVDYEQAINIPEGSEATYILKITKETI